MSVRHFRSGVASAALALLLSLGPGAVGLMAGEAAGSIAVSSDPVGAEVYVDGRLEGETPVRLDGVGVGQHSVRLVKPGFLESRRVVEVAAGETLEVAVPLSESAPAGAPLQGESSSSGGGGGGKKALLIGLGVAAAGAGAYFAFRDTNDPPSAPTVSCTPGTGLASATSISCSAQATDPDGDSLTYTWDFGDSASGSGPTASHTYANAGTYAVTATASDGEETATGSGSVTIRDLSGTWTGSFLFDNSIPIGTTVTLTQNAGSLSGSYSDVAGYSGPVAGSVSPQLGVVFTVSPPGIIPFQFIGEVDASISRLSGTAVGSGLDYPWNLSR